MDKIDIKSLLTNITLDKTVSSLQRVEHLEASANPKFGVPPCAPQVKFAVLNVIMHSHLLKPGDCIKSNYTLYLNKLCYIEYLLVAEMNKCTPYSGYSVSYFFSVTSKPQSLSLFFFQLSGVPPVLNVQRRHSDGAIDIMDLTIYDVL